MIKVLKHYFLPLCIALLGFSGFLNANSRLSPATHHPSDAFRLQQLFLGTRAYIPTVELNIPGRRDNVHVISEENREETSRPNFQKKQFDTTETLHLIGRRLSAFLPILQTWQKRFAGHYYPSPNRRCILLRMLRI